MGNRITYSLDKDWSFHLGDIDLPPVKSHGDVYNTTKSGNAVGVPQSDYDVRSWEVVDLPHDWSVRQPFDKEGVGDWGYKPKGKAWYRKSFLLPEAYKGKQITIDFEGVATYCTVYFNGSVLKRNFTGYAPFTVDITDRAHYGSAPNILAVFVDGDAYEGWWYEGAGIYRHTWLTVKEPIHIGKYGVFLKAEKRTERDWDVTMETTVCNLLPEDREVTVLTKFLDPDGDMEIDVEVEDIPCEAYEEMVISGEVEIDSPKIWDINSPKVYKIVTELYVDGELWDTEETVYGFRTIAFDAEKGFMLNGRSVKLFGTCNHQDHGGIGVAVPDSIHEYRIERLKEMGSNAYRTAHGMPHKELLDACDKYGMLVMDENRAFETSEENLEQLRTMVLRDRNHPSVILYSIFNEEPLQGTPEGRNMARRMKREIEQLDDTRFVTGAMHGGVLEDSGAADILDVCGVNYQIDVYDAFHEKFPNVPVLGSETTSCFSVRGCYETDEGEHVIASYDEDSAPWGNTVRETWEAVLSRDFVAGAFMWTGFDYLGEPTPHAWPSVSSFFGLMDTCGFAKDAFYLAKAIFSEEPYCHVAPHWNWKGREGRTVRVMSHTNCEEAELFINKKSYGKQPVEKTKQVYWDVPYEPGVLELIGYKDGLKCVHDVKITTGEATRIQIQPWRARMSNDGADAIPFQIIAVDENGHEVPDANFPVEVNVTGGTLLGMANGDPNCHEDFTSNKRSVFQGRCQAVVRADAGEKQLMVTASAPGMGIGSVMIPLVESGHAPFLESTKELYLQGFKMTARVSMERPDPNQPVDGFDMNTWVPVNPEHGAPPQFGDAPGAYGIYRVKAQIPEEINGNPPTLHFHGIWGNCEVYINGKLRGSCAYEWPQVLDIPLLPEEYGEAEIRVLVKCCNIGAGLTSSVIIR